MLWWNTQASRVRVRIAFSIAQDRNIVKLTRIFPCGYDSSQKAADSGKTDQKAVFVREMNESAFRGLSCPGMRSSLGCVNA